MIAQWLAALPFMTPTRVDLVMAAFWPMVKAGFVVSVPLASVSFVIGLVLALAVAMLRVSTERPWYVKLGLRLCQIYVSMIRGTPLLVQLCVVFYGLPAIGISLNPIPTAIIGFSLNVGAYASETIRAAIESVPRGQWEAAYSGGMSTLQTFRFVILPQAARVAVPPLTNTFIGLFKDTSLAAVVTVTELFRVAQQVANTAYDFLPVYIEAGVVYWLFCWVLFAVQARLEKRMKRYSVM